MMSISWILETVTLLSLIDVASYSKRSGRKRLSFWRKRSDGRRAVDLTGMVGQILCSLPRQFFDSIFAHLQSV